MARLRRRSYRPIDVWPGYVDALTTLLLTITFILTVYVLAQFFLSQVLSGREKALARLSEQIAALTAELTSERAAKLGLEGDRKKQQAEITQLTRELATSKSTSEGLSTQLAAEKKSSTDALTQVDILNQQIAELRQQLAQLASALEVSDTKNRESQATIADLGKRLEIALAAKVAEMARYRSEFFGRLREVLGDRPEVRVVGDRFVFQSEVLFPSGSADLSPEGQKTLTAFARTLLDIAKKIPNDVPWVLRVDGHTDRVPIASSRFPSNWELSAARATSVVKFLISRDVPAPRLAATGFGEFQPIDNDKNTAANARNRRIEMRLTDR